MSTGFVCPFINAIENIKKIAKSGHFCCCCRYTLFLFFCYSMKRDKNAYRIFNVVCS